MFKRDLEFEERQVGGLFHQGAIDGDKNAIEQAMRYCVPALTEFLLRYCDKKGHSRGFAEIVASVTMMRALAKASSFDPQKRLMPWLKVIARRELISLHRVEVRLDRRYTSLDRMPLLPSQDEDELNKLRGREILEPRDELVRREDDAKHRQREEMLDEAIQGLTGLKRRVIDAYRAGNSVGVIAVMLDVPPDRVSKALFDAKAELRRRLRRQASART